MTFILEPLYKITATVIGEHPKTIERMLGEEFGLHLKSSAYSQDVKPLLKEASVIVIVIAGQSADLCPAQRCSTLCFLQQGHAVVLFASSTFCMCVTVSVR